MAGRVRNTVNKVALILFLIVPVCTFSQNIDIRILRSMNSPEPLPSDNFFRFVSNSYIYVVSGVPAGMAVAGLIGHDDVLFRNACVTLAATAVNYGITTAMKYSINRDRPYVTYPDITKKSGGGSPFRATCSRFVWIMASPIHCATKGSRSARQH